MDVNLVLTIVFGVLAVFQWRKSEKLDQRGRQKVPDTRCLAREGQAFMR